MLLLIKQQQLAYPLGQFAIELIILITYAFLTAAKVSVGFLGNKTETAKWLVVMMVFGVFCCFTNVYFLVWQTWIMRMEVLLGLTAVGFSVLEIGAALVAICWFRSLDRPSQEQD